MPDSLACAARLRSASDGPLYRELEGCVRSLAAFMLAIGRVLRERGPWLPPGWAGCAKAQAFKHMRFIESNCTPRSRRTLSCSRIC